MPKRVDYELIDHGIQHSDYFQGCGTAFTRFNNVVTGIGDNPAEAIDDCLEQIAMMDHSICMNSFEQQILEDNEWERFPELPSVSGNEEEGDEDEESNDMDEFHPWYHVSIRFNTELIECDDEDV